MDNFTIEWKPVLVVRPNGKHEVEISYKNMHYKLTDIPSDLAEIRLELPAEKP